MNNKKKQFSAIKISDLPGTEYCNIPTKFGVLTFSAGHVIWYGTALLRAYSDTGTTTTVLVYLQALPVYMMFLGDPYHVPTRVFSSGYFFPDNEMWAYFVQ